MVCLRFEPWATEWWAQMKPRSYGGQPSRSSLSNEIEIKTGQDVWYNSYRMRPVWPVKSRQMSIEVAQKWFHWKNKDFYTFTKIG